MVNEPGACANYRVTIAVPCFNEAARLNIAAFQEFLSNHNLIRFIFVDDGSSDDTARILEQICVPFKERTVILRQNANRGKAEAVRIGLNYAIAHWDQEIVGFWDADLATPLDAIDRFLSVFESRPEVEMVFGSRVKLLGRSVERKPLRHYLGRVFATAVSSMLRLPIYDTQCGAKLFRITPQLRDVLKAPFLSQWVFDVEILARYLVLYNKDSRHLEKIIYEYPLEKWIDAAGSKVQPRHFFTALADIVRIEYTYLL